LNKILNAPCAHALKKDESVKGTIHIIVNGMEEEVPEGATLAFLIEHFQEKDPALSWSTTAALLSQTVQHLTALPMTGGIHQPDFGGSG
jgi:hypothetical protein